MYDHTRICLITVALKVSGHCSIVIVFNVKYMTLESINGPVFCSKLIFSQTEPIFVKKTSFRLNSVKASSRLRKMFSQCYYNQNVVWENVCPTIFFFWTPIFIICYINLDCGKGFHYCHLYVIWNI